MYLCRLIDFFFAYYWFDVFVFSLNIQFLQDPIYVDPSSHSKSRRSELFFTAMERPRSLELVNSELHGFPAQSFSLLGFVSKWMDTQVALQKTKLQPLRVESSSHSARLQEANGWSPKSRHSHYVVLSDGMRVNLPLALSNLSVYQVVSRIFGMIPPMRKTLSLFRFLIVGV